MRIQRRSCRMQQLELPFHSHYTRQPAIGWLEFNVPFQHNTAITETSNLHQLAPPDQNWRTLLEQCFTARMPLLTATSTFALASSPPRCYLNRLCVTAARAWNSLPTSVTTATSLASFKKQLKTFLFTKQFPEFQFVYRVLEALLLMPR